MELLYVALVALVIVGAVVTVGRLIQRSACGVPGSAKEEAEIEQSRAHGIGGSPHSGPF